MMNNYKIIILLLIIFSSCNLVDPNYDNKSEDINVYVNNTLNTLKGYQPIDPISINFSGIDYDEMI